MSSAGVMKTAAKFFYPDVVYKCTPAVPINSANLRSLVGSDFAEHCKFPIDIVSDVDSPDWEVAAQSGAWRRTTPEEMVHAHVGRGARRG